MYLYIIVSDCPREKNPKRDNNGISVKPQETDYFIILYKYVKQRDVHNMNVNLSSRALRTRVRLQNELLLAMLRDVIIYNIIVGMSEKDISKIKKFPPYLVVRPEYRAYIYIHFIRLKSLYT